MPAFAVASSQLGTLAVVTFCDPAAIFAPHGALMDVGVAFDDDLRSRLLIDPGAITIGLDRNGRPDSVTVTVSGRGVDGPAIYDALLAAGFSPATIRPALP